MNRPRQYARGITLMEVLITTAVLAAGLLGLAGLLTKSTSMAEASYTRTLVTARIYSLADRMRLNRAGVDAGAYDDLSGAPGAVPACAGTAACSAAEVAQMDYSEWARNLAAMLPNGQGSVAGTNGVFTITVTWTDPQDSDGQQNQSYALTVQP